ncbi:MAG: hypothetical protein KGL43_00195 [Burkholderiales bacterium]|nr:hypothetical protein [Burkholderiales bacterium]MDE2451986.1 hypothetical protein [Burkholderiales bacterium]
MSAARRSRHAPRPLRAAVGQAVAGAVATALAAALCAAALILIVVVAQPW